MSLAFCALTSNDIVLEHDIFIIPLFFSSSFLFWYCSHMRWVTYRGREEDNRIMEYTRPASISSHLSPSPLLSSHPTPTDVDDAASLNSPAAHRYDISLCSPSSLSRQPAVKCVELCCLDSLAPSGR